MPRAYSLQLSRFSLFPPVKTCLCTGLLGIAGRDQRGLSFFIRGSALPSVGLLLRFVKDWKPQ